MRHLHLKKLQDASRTKTPIRMGKMNLIRFHHSQINNVWDKILLMSFIFLTYSHIIIGNPDLGNLKEKLNLKIITKNEWGAKPVDVSKMKPHKIEKITIHHGGVVDDGKEDSKKKTLGLQIFSQNDRKWADVPYHYMIDLNGNILEGRDEGYAGDSNTPYDPTTHFLIEVMGNYMVQKLNEKQYQSMVNLCVYACLKYNISPDTIKGHKDYAETQCPGDDIYNNYLKNGKLIDDVKKKLKELKRL